MLDWIFDALVGWIFTNVIAGIDVIVSDCVYAFSPNLITFQTYFPMLEDFYSTIKTISHALLIALFIYKIIESILTANSKTYESPFITMVRFGLATIAMTVLPAIVTRSIKFADIIYWEMNTIGTTKMETLTDTIGSLENGYTLKGMFSSIGNFILKGLEEGKPIWEIAIGESGLSTCLMQLITLIMIIVLAWNYFKLLLTLGERYIAFGLMFYTMPLACVPIISKTSSPITKAWVRMVFSTLMVLILNVWFICAFRWTALNANLPLTFYDVNGNNMGGIILWEILLLSFLKVAQRIDSYINALGFSTVQTANGVAGAIMGTFGGMAMATRGASRMMGQNQRAFGTANPFSKSATDFKQAQSNARERTVSMDKLNRMPKGSTISGEGNFNGMNDDQIKSTLRRGGFTLANGQDAINYAKRNIPADALNGKEITDATISSDGTIKAKYTSGDTSGTLTIKDNLDGSGNWMETSDGRYMQDSNDSVGFNPMDNETPNTESSAYAFADGDNPKVPVDIHQKDGNYIADNIEPSEQEKLLYALDNNVETSLNQEQFGTTDDGRSFLYDKEGNAAFEVKPTDTVNEDDVTVATAYDKDGNNLSFVALNDMGQHHTVTGGDTDGSEDHVVTKGDGSEELVKGQSYTMGTNAPERHHYAQKVKDGYTLVGTPEAAKAISSMIPGMDKANISPNTAYINRAKMSGTYTSKDPEIGTRTFTAIANGPEVTRPSGSRLVDTEMGQYFVTERTSNGRIVNTDEKTCFAPESNSLSETTDVPTVQPFMPERSFTMESPNQTSLYEGFVRDMKTLDNLEAKILKGEQVSSADLENASTIIAQVESNVSPILEQDRINMENSTRNNPYKQSAFGKNASAYASQRLNAPLADKATSTKEYYDNYFEHMEALIAKAKENVGSTEGPSARDIAENEHKELDRPY